LILKTKETEFRALFAQYVAEFLNAPEGQEHLRRYDEVRAIGRKNFEDIRGAAENGADVTNEVLLRLLPHTNSTAHRASGAWVHVAPAVQKNIQEWFEGVGWTQPEDWPKVALAILIFVSECADDPSALMDATGAFSDDPHTRGLQTGLLTPILNAVRPDDFLILNNKSRRVVNYFTGNNFKQPLVNYSDANNAELSLINSMAAIMRELSGSDARSSDLFDMFAHWLTAIRKHPSIVERKVKTGDGEVVVSVPDNAIEEAPLDAPAATAAEPRQSYRIQAALAHIGTKLSFRVWVPRSDRQSVLSLVPPSRHKQFLTDLPLNYDDLTLKTIEQIDVIWMKGRSMARAFEVEHTTAIYSGLLRMSDLLALQPNMDIRLHIAAPQDRRDKVRQEILRPTFSLLERRPLYKMCSFLPYAAVEEMNALAHLESMNESIVDKFEERFEEEDDI
jgi:hypothetical protein